MGIFKGLKSILGSFKDTEKKTKKQIVKEILIMTNGVSIHDYANKTVYHPKHGVLTGDKIMVPNVGSGAKEHLICIDEHGNEHNLDVFELMDGKRVDMDFELAKSKLGKEILRKLKDPWRMQLQNLTNRSLIGRCPNKLLRLLQANNLLCEASVHPLQ